MPLYRKKPVVISAEQWFPGKEVEGVVLARPNPDRDPEFRPYVETLEGFMLVEDGAYIITGIKGEKYPCKEDIFLATYELVEDDNKLAEELEEKGLYTNKPRTIDSYHSELPPAYAGDPTAKMPDALMPRYPKADD